MDNTLYVGLSREMALQRHMDVVANNLANMNTTAFKRESVLFRQYLKDAHSDQPGLPDKIAFVFDYGVGRNFTPGSYDKTGNPLDIALTGRGFMAVSGNNGETLYTKNGHMQVGSDGRLVTPSGNAIEDVNGNDIVLTGDPRSITIARDGTISGSQGPIARLSVVEFAPEDEQSIEKVGDSLFRTQAQPQPATGSEVLQGMIEGSNVEPIQEMTQMMEISRAYQNTARMLDQYQDMQNQAIERLGKVQ
jgi:flagellar basal-body rod protein FlgF